MLAELRALQWGLHLMWEEGYREIIREFQLALRNVES